MTEHRKPEIDPERRHEEAPFNRDRGYSGQDFDIRDQDRVRDAAPSGTVAARPADAGDGPGARASFDPATGETRGSGGAAEEDYDADTPNTGEGDQGGAKG